MDNASFGMFDELDNYNAREEFAMECQNEEEADYIPGLDDGEWMENDEWDPIMGDADEWPETDDDFAADYYGEEEFA